MPGWKLKWQGNVPGSSKVCSKLAPRSSRSESKLPSSAVTLEIVGIDKPQLRLCAAVWNPAGLRLLADAPSVHARREGQIAGVVDRWLRLLALGDT